ncbi:MAG TPA: 5-formyltetrahydrofolate cyclo-ligase [Arachnia sp.]|nr:5-formyltetrahydrofolate cyclo-ligase [Arachnia sp.]
MTLSARKDALRARISAARARVSAEQWAADNAARTRLLLTLADEFPVGTAAVYVSREGEPGSVEAIDTLAARGWSLLLPRITGRGVAWARFDGWSSMATGWGGIAQPTGPVLPPEALAEAGLVVAPCLAVGADGARLGTGGGWYDRALLHRHPLSFVVALARDEEIRDDLGPLTLPHDIPIDGYVTERESVRLTR